MEVFVFSTYPTIRTSVRQDGLRGPHLEPTLLLNLLQQLVVIFQQPVFFFEHLKFFP
jgi:hypothetical protein